MSAAALFDAPRRERWKGSRALVPLCKMTCPTCGGYLMQMTVGQAALFRDCGYGATLNSTTRWCPACGWQLLAEQSEGRP